ncbi:hypothetical protein BDZ88DRAFT_61266 [Geranomyces variabilis]|nr:hypothetical protein BDZ88DRAFT_61266 [Geranomyces variabilis]KAJ3134937.1 hypothetical protein HDU90_004262 [Geranomyces variabilis]
MVKISIFAGIAAAVAGLASAAPVENVCKNTGPILNWQLFNVCEHVCNRYTVKTVAEIQQIVRNAAAAGRGVKALGAHHTYTDNACKLDADIIEMIAMNNVVEINKEEGYIWVESGATFAKINAALALKGMGIFMAQPAAPTITIGGALANSAHGSAWTSNSGVPQNTLAIEFVNATGHVETLTEDDKERFAAMRTNLGLLGIVTKVKYAAHDASLITFGFDTASEKDAIAEGFLPTLNSNDAMLAWYFPPLKRYLTLKMNRLSQRGDIGTPNAPAKASADQVQSTMRNTFAGMLEHAIRCAVPIGRPADCDDNNSKNNATMPASSVALDTDVASGMSAFDSFKDKIGDLIPKMKFSLPVGLGDDELCVPLKRHQEAMALVRDVFAQYHDFEIGFKGLSAAFPLVQFRFAKPDDVTYLALNSASSPADKDLWSEGAVWMEIWFAVTAADENRTGKLRLALEQGLMALGARPHWAKNREITLEGAAKRYGNAEAFSKIRREMDPTDMFYNDFARRAGL